VKPQTVGLRVVYSAVYLIKFSKWSTVIMSLKRKSPAEVCDAHRSTPSTSSTDAAEKHQPALEENEAPLRKRTRTDSFEKLPSLHHRDSGSSDQRNERSAEGKLNDHYKSIHTTTHYVKIKLMFLFIYPKTCLKYLNTFC